MTDGRTDVFELLRRAKAGDLSARDAVIENNMGLVGSIVKKYTGRGQEYEDLFQIGAIGLIKAVDRFDMSYGVQFSTYAVPMIAGEIKRFLRDDGMIKVSRSVKELAFKVKQVREELLRECDEEPAVAVIAERLGVEPCEVVTAIEASYAPESLHAPMSEDQDASTLIDKVEQSAAPSESEIIDRLDLQWAMEALMPEDRKIIALRYYKGMTQTQVAKILKISQVQVSRTEKRIIRTIREKISVV